MRRARGWSLVELLVIISILSLLVTILMPTLGRVRHLSKRAVCATSLSAAVKGLQQYAAEYATRFPSCGFGARNSRFDVMGKDLTSNPAEADSNSRNLFLAVRLRHLQPGHLICPATSDEPAAMESSAQQVYYDFNTGGGSGFQSKCSYSYHLQFKDRIRGAKGYPAAMTSHQELALLADRNPFVIYPGADYQANIVITGTPATTNSENHAKMSADDVGGQNVAFLGGHVRWSTVPTVGPDGDNIYTVWHGTDKAGGTLSPDSMPRDKADSIVVP